METFLYEIIAKVNRKRHLLELECDALRELLKPWPSKKSIPRNVEEEEGKGTQIKPDGGDAGCEALTHAEKQALLQVDQLLNKAQKTRQLKSKLKTEESDSHPEGEGATVAVKGSKDCRPTPPDTRISSKSDKNSSSKPSLNSESSATSGRVQSGKTKVLRADIATDPGGSHVSATESSGRLSSASRPSSRLSSSKGRHTPAHMSAPFKTESHTKVPARRVNELAKTRSRRANVMLSNPMGGRGFKTLPQINPTSSLKTKGTKTSAISSVKDCSNPPVSSEDSIGSNSLETSNGDICEAGDPQVQPDILPDPTPSLRDILPDPTPSLCESVADCRDQLDTHLHISSGNRTDIALEDQHLFSLKRNGSSLKLPSQLTKLIAANDSLRQRCLTAQLTKKVGVANPGEQFVNKLESHYQVGEELRTRMHAIACKTSHEILLDVLNSLQLDKISKNSPYEDIYRAKVMVEFILRKFSELQDETMYLSKVQFRRLPALVPASTDRQEDIPGQWLCTEQEDRVTDGLSFDVRERLKCSRLWSHLKFSEQFLQLQIHLIRLLDSQWWSTVDLGARDPSVIQAIYGLLTTCGQFLPAFVDNTEFS